MTTGRKKGISAGLFAVLMVLTIIGTLGWSGYSYYREKYAEEHRLYSEEQFRRLDENSLE